MLSESSGILSHVTEFLPLYFSQYCYNGYFFNHTSSIDDIDYSNILDISTELITSPKSFVKDVVERLELQLVTPKSGRADTAGPSCSITIQ